MAEFDVEVGFKLAAATDKLSGELERNRKRKPYHIKRVDQVNALAGVASVLDLGSPPTGMMWNLLKLTVVGSDDRTVVAGATLASYAGDPANPSLAMLLEPSIGGSPIPNTAGYSDEVIWVHSEDNLFVMVYGAAAGQQLVAIAIVDEWIQEEA